MSNAKTRNLGKVAKGISLVVFAPVRSVAKSGVLMKDQCFKTYTLGKESITGATDIISKNWNDSFKEGRNDQFSDIFAGEEGEHLIDHNNKKFLCKKRTALFCMYSFLIYGSTCVIMFKSFSAIFGMVASIILGITLATEAEFRLWQLKVRRLSKEEKGGVKYFYTESSILNILNPELMGGRKDEK